MTTIFLDCDGVLADFDKTATEVLGMHPRLFNDLHGDREFWELIEGHSEFFYNLSPMEDAHILVQGVLSLSAHYSLGMPIILTGVPRGPWAEGQKRRWRNNHFPELNMICTPSREKYKHMQPGDIIIDDWAKHQKTWEDAGGLWILHKDAKQSLQELQQLLEDKYGS